MSFNNLISEEGFWVHYKKIVLQDINNASGAKKQRVVFNPDSVAKEQCKKIVTIVQDNFPEAFTENWGISAFSTFFQHIDSRKGSQCLVPKYWYCPDIKSAFPTVTLDLFKKLLGFHFEKVGPVETLENFCFLPPSEGGGLIQGAPSSNALFHLFMSRIDKKFKDLLWETGIVYNRYCDDLLFSCTTPISHQTRKDIMSVLHRSGLKQSDKKTRSYDLEKNVLECFGYTLRIQKATKDSSQKFFISLRQEYLTHLRGYYHAIQKKGDTLSAKDISKELGMFNGLMNKKSEHGLLKTATEVKIQELIVNASNSIPKKVEKLGEQVIIPYYSRDTMARSVNQYVQNNLDWLILEIENSFKE